jgi:hypothetical protein
MGVDGPDDFDLPDFRDASSTDSRSPVAVEERDRFEYWEDLRAAVAADAWELAAERFRRQWTSHCERWPAESRPAADRSSADRSSADRSGDPPGSWRGDGGRYLDAAANAEVEKRCEQIAEVERDVVSPAMREIEACDPERQLVGFDHRLKGLDRLKDKVAASVEEMGRSPQEAMSLVPDAIRYTLTYSEARYARGVLDDICHLKEYGFELVKLKNYWPCDQYRGVNSQWMDSRSGQRFEVQFHTEISFAAKQLAHGAYERLRSNEIGKEEELELTELQCETTRQIPVPFAAETISEYQKKGDNVR